MVATLEELEPMVCYSDLRQVFPCRSMGARIMGDEAVKCQRTAAKRNLDVVRLSRMLTCAKLCLTGEQAVRTHYGDAVKPCSRWSDCGKGSQVPACEERVAALKRRALTASSEKLPCWMPNTVDCIKSVRTWENNLRSPGSSKRCL